MTSPSPLGEGRKPLAIDLYCGLGGWTEGLLAEGWDVIGFDIEQHRYPARALPEANGRKIAQDGVDFNNKGGSSRNRSFNYANQCAVCEAPLTGGWIEYPAQLVVQDVLTLHGSQFRNADMIVASPPCQAYSYRAMPWKRAKALPPPDNTLFEACFRIQREACEAAGRHIPLIVENVRGAQKWVGRARWNYGSFYLWGDVPALMPPIRARAILKQQPYERRHGTGSWFAIDMASSRDGVKVPAQVGRRTDVGARFTSRDCGLEAEGLKAPGINLSEIGFNVANRQRFGGMLGEGTEYQRTAEDKRQHIGVSRKFASAMIAKIPLPLSRWIGRSFYPREIREQAA